MYFLMFIPPQLNFWRRTPISVCAGTRCPHFKHSQLPTIAYLSSLIRGPIRDISLSLQNIVYACIIEGFFEHGNKGGPLAGMDIATLQHLATSLILLSNGVLPSGATKEYRGARWCIAKKLLEKGAGCLNCCVEGYTPLHTAVRKGSLEIVKLLLSEGSLVDKKSGDEKNETPLQLAVRLGTEYKDIVEFLMEKDSSWTEQGDVIEKTFYPAIAGGHKNILRLLIQRGNLNVDNYGHLLKVAVEKNNLAAVNNLFAGWNVGDGTEPDVLPYPQDSDVDKALAVATQMKDKFVNSGQDKESKTAEEIIKRLSSPEKVPAGSVETKATNKVPNKIHVSGSSEHLDDILKEKKKQYIRLLKDLKKTDKKEEYKVMDYYLQEFAKLHEKTWLVQAVQDRNVEAVKDAKLKMKEDNWTDNQNRRQALGAAEDMKTAEEEWTHNKLEMEKLENIIQELKT